MWQRSIATLIFVFALPVGLACWVAAPVGAEAPQSRPALSFVRKPLRHVLEQLSTMSGLSLEAEKELENQKLVLLVKERPVAEVLDRLAELLGAEWVDTPAKGEMRGRRLQRLPVTKQWIDRWRLLRSKADAAARRKQSEFVRKLWDDLLRDIDDPSETATRSGSSIDLDAARFLKTLGSAPLDRLAVQFGEMSPTRAGGEGRRQPPAVVFSFTDLAPGQQSMLRNYFASRVRDPQDYHARFLAQLPRARIALTSSNGVSIELDVQAPFRPEPSTIGVLGSAYSPEKIAEFSDNEFGRMMAGGKTPEEVLLGAQLRSNLSADPMVEIDEPESLTDTRVKLTAPPLRWEFFTLPALSEAGLNIVADHYTSSVRLSKPAQTVKELLVQASSDYRTVFRRRGPYLMARKIVWPDADLAEPPLMEEWIDRKKSAHPEFSFEEIAQMASLADEQLDLLAAYKDPVTRIEFRDVASAARFSPEHRRLLQAVAALPPAQQKQLRLESGLPLSTAPRFLREAVALNVPPHLRRDAGRSRLRATAGAPFANRPSLTMSLVMRVPRGEYAPLAVLARI